MKRSEIIEKAKANKRNIGIGMAIAVAVIALLIGLVCCNAGGENDKGTAANIPGSEEGAKGSSASSSSSSARSSEGPAPDNKGGSGEVSNDTHETASDNGNGNIAHSHESDDGSDKASSGGNSANASSSQEPQRRWVDDYENVWVVDSPAWTETVPIYESRERSICNICGSDITGNTSAHGKEHMKAGQGSGHHSEVQRVQVGTNVISHPEEGHWETKVVGGHWE